MKKVILSLLAIAAIWACKTEDPGVVKPEETNAGKNIVRSLLNDDAIIGDYFQKDGIEYFVINTEEDKFILTRKRVNDKLSVGFLAKEAAGLEWSEDNEIKSGDLNHLVFWVYDADKGLDKANLYDTMLQFASAKAGKEIKNARITGITFREYAHNPVKNVEVNYRYEGHDTNFILSVNPNAAKIVGISCEGGECCTIRYYPDKGYFECGCSGCVMTLDD